MSLKLVRALHAIALLLMVATPLTSNATSDFGRFPAYDSTAAQATPGRLQLISGFTNDSQAGLVITTGNTKTQTYNLNQENSYTFGDNRFSAGASYLRTKSQGLESAKRWTTKIRYDRHIVDNFGVFVSELVEGDRFAGFYQRYNSDAGATLRLFKTRKLTGNSELGYRYLSENRTDSSNFHRSLSRMYGSLDAHWNSHVKSRLGVEYLQSLTEFGDYFINGQATLTAVLTNFLSLQLSYDLRFRKQPPATASRLTDTVFSTGLVASF